MSTSRTIPIAHMIIAFSSRCFAANSSIDLNRSSPSSSFAMTSSPSTEECILLPPDGSERLRLDLEPPRDLLRELRGVAEHGVDASGSAVLGEFHKVVEVPVVAER